MVNVKKLVSVGLLAVLFVSCLPLMVNAEASWLEGYERRVLFYWQSSGAGQDSFTVYNQTGFNIDSKFYIYNETQSDFEDLRVTLADGTTMLNLWNQTTVEQTSVKVWCNFPVANDSYYLYWNNALTESNFNKTTVFNGVVSGVLGAWNMEEATATNAIIDYSGYGNNGTATGTNIVAGKFEGTTARNFDGNDKITVTYENDALLTGNLSIVTYFKQSSPVDGRIIHKYGAPNNRGFSLFTTTGSYCRYVIWGGTTASPTGSILNNDNVFHTIVYEYMTGNLTGYNNNNIDGTGALTNADYSNTADIIIGCDYYTSYLQGTLAGLYILNYALTSSERALFNNYYPDATLISGELCLRSWIPNSVINNFGAVETAAVVEDLLVEDAIGVAVVFGVVAIALTVVFAAKNKS